MIKRRYLYVLLFAIPATLTSLAVAAAMVAVAAGVMWIHLFGDSSWPSSAESFLDLLAKGSVLVTFIGILAIAYRVGRQAEAQPSFNSRHIRFSINTTLVFAVAIALRFGVPMLFPKSDDELCSEICKERGFNGSGMPPRTSGDRTCTCYGPEGEVLRFTLPERHR